MGSKHCCLAADDTDMQDKSQTTNQKILDAKKVQELWNRLRGDCDLPDEEFIRSVVKKPDFGSQSNLSKDDPETEKLCEAFRNTAAANGEYIATWNCAFECLGGCSEGLPYIKIYSMRFHSTIFKHTFQFPI